VGKVTALWRCDVELVDGSVRVRAAFAERSNGEIVVGPPKSAAGRRVAGIPNAIRQDVSEHLARFAG
jgi:hypothetical protein